ncbi:MAG TPA: porphobilinogen synthase [Candidatus Bathyarchaeia archaeon]|nr:porphobilinogen synthase [Candidatus Bathyarchaeia archaeon]
MISEIYETSKKFKLTQRPRRLRRSQALRTLAKETRLSSLDLVYPIFVDARIKSQEPIQSMPGINRLPLSEVHKEALEISSLKIPAILVFGLPERKDATGTEAYASSGIVQQAIQIIKKTAPQLAVISDVCLCEYTDHGHCGIVKNGSIDNDETLNLLGNVAVSQVRAGADIVAPSAMMDGQVKAIRNRLDESNLNETAIMAYSAKFASAFYGPFREAAESTPRFGDRRAYQMDPPNKREALREIALDIQEGADIVMVKPALSYLDIINQARNQFNTPLAAYNVSGEYAMIKAAGNNGWIDEKAVTMEVLTSIKRAGADIIITYFAKDVARQLQATTQ